MERGNALRDRENADVGVLFNFIDNDLNCGLASEILTTIENAFVVVNSKCINPQLGTVVAHEIGHLFGARHVLRSDSNLTPFAFGHGYDNVSQGHYTIMSYPCNFDLRGCTWHNQFSDPDELFFGSTTTSGTSSRENNAKVMTLVAPYIASFKGGNEIYAQIQDTTPPVISNTPADITKTIDSGTFAVVTFTIPTTNEGTVTCDHSSGSLYPIGITTVICTAIDDNENSAFVSFDIIVSLNPDTVKPVIIAPTDKTFEATSTLTTLSSTQIGTATATDNRDSSPTITNDAPNSFPLGDTIITWTATDGSGNSATATQTVTVRDTVPPSITPVPFGVYVSVGADAPSTIDFEVPDVTDAVDATVTASCTPAPGALLSPGVTVVMCTASDASGNSASMSFTLNVNLSYAHSPQILSADVTDSAVVLDWYRPTFGGDVTGYQILRSNATTTDMAVIWQGVSTSFVDYTVLPDTEYTYQAISVNGTRISAPSNAVTVMTDPAGLVGLMAISTDGAVTLTWNDVPGADRYVVRKSVAVDSLISRYAWFLGGDILTVTDHSVSAGETFVYHVVADDRTDYHNYLHYDFVKVTVE